ncbi:unnamed protein product [Durusdinium trenchii]|uniref:WH2 domain-containing protein n=2 Tax=Durusdinium trenchii TaxID=1381693 RepID=A0ABP0IZQ7_9DINO
MMHGLLASVENLNQRSKDIFDRLDAACSQADARILGLEERLGAAVARIEGARGSTAALKVQSARTFSGRGKPELHASRLVIDEGLLLSVRQTADLPEELGAPLPSATSSAEELARVSRSVTHHCNLVTPDPPFKKKRNERLLPVEGRLSSVSELFLLNSSEQPYRVRHEVDNLAELEDELRKPRVLSAEAPKTASPEVGVDLEEDEPERAMEDLRFRPRPATAEVTFDLPDVLPDLGHVAHITWSEGGETERPAWDVAPAELARRASTAKPREAPAAPKVKRQPPPPPKQPVTVAPAPAAPSTSSTSAPAAVPTPVTEKPKAQPPPAPVAKGKGKDKGKGKEGKGKGGKGPPPPPPAKKAGGTAPPAKAPAMKAEGVGKAAMFADIRAGAKLRKVAPPKERSGAAIGRVV